MVPRISALSLITGLMLALTALLTPTLSFFNHRAAGVSHDEALSFVMGTVFPLHQLIVTLPTIIVILLMAFLRSITGEEWSVRALAIMIMSIVVAAQVGLFFAFAT